MSLKGKMVGQREIKSDGDVFHELFRNRPHEISKMSPQNVQGADLHEGDWGVAGSIFSWHYTHDGKKKVAKVIIEAIDEDKKLVKFKALEGDLMEEYKTYSLTLHVDTKVTNEEKSNVVTWTIEYEKLNENVDDPNTFMDLCLNLTKDIETHHLNQSTAQN